MTGDPSTPTGPPTAVEILNATLDELRNEPRFVVENRAERRARLRRRRQQTK